MKASDIITRARDIIQDAGGHYWTVDELMRWLADARAEAYKLRPDLYEVTEDLPLTAGATQKLPNGSRWLFEVVSNVSAPRRRSVTVADGKVLDRHRPSWRGQSGVAEIRHYLYDDRSPSQFEVYPPAREGVVVAVSYAKPPAATIAANDELVPEGEHGASLTDFVLYRSFLKEADTVPAFFARATNHLTLFQGAMTGAIQTKLATSPNAKA